MAKKIFRTCICCGNKYEYCNHCGKNITPWKNLYCSEECRAVMNIVSAYNVGRVNKDKVKAVLDEYKVTDYTKYSKDINKVLAELFAKPVEQIVKKEIVKDEPVTESVKTVEQVQPAETKNRRPRRGRRY